MDFQGVEQQVHRLAVQYQAAREAVDREAIALDEAQGQERTTVAAQQIVQSIAQTIQQQVHQQIATVVTRCLTAVFDEPYEFSIQFVQKRGKTEAQLQFTRDGLVLDDPLNEVGGGVIDVAALALRLAVILLSRPPRRRLLVLDEPWKNIRGEQNRTRTRQMLQRLAEELGIQFIINTDIPAYRLGTVVEITDDHHDD